MKRVLGYTRISKADRTRDESLGIEAQRAAIRGYVAAQRWELVGWFTDDGVSGRSMRRPGVAAALKELKAHRADGLVVAKLDRLSRSVVDFAGLLDKARKQRWTLAVLNLQLDTSTATGTLMAHMLSAVAEFEREVIGEWTRAALAVKRAEGVPLGKPSTIPADVQDRIIAAHRAGQTFSAIARGLDTDAVPTPGGSARWHHGVVAGVVRRAMPPAPHGHRDGEDPAGEDHPPQEHQGAVVHRQGEHEDQRQQDDVDGPQPLPSSEPASPHDRERRAVPV